MTTSSFCTDKETIIHHSDNEIDTINLIHGNIYLLPENLDDNSFSITTYLSNISLLTVEDMVVFKSKHKPKINCVTENIYKLQTNTTIFHPQGTITILKIK